MSCSCARCAATNPPRRGDPRALPWTHLAQGFDAVVGNPPWVSYAGRAAQPLDRPRRAWYARHYASFRGYRNLQGLFVERATTLGRPGARVALVLPSSMAELDGYAPVREVFDTPMVFVVGTADPAQTRVNERVARAWARRAGVPLAYPVVTDDALTDAMADGRTLVLVGTPQSHRVLARLADRLPLRFDGADLLVGAQRHTGADLGAVFATHHPDHPERALLVITGNSPAALYRSLSLPDLIPAYTVFDGRVAPARGRVLLGGLARVRAAGFFDAEGRPLPNDADPVQTLTEGDD